MPKRSWHNGSMRRIGVYVMNEMLRREALVFCVLMGGEHVS
jgi:hypothetical protein